MVKEAGAEFVIIGHSERRRLFHETDETVNRKLLAALGAQLTPIVCIGETLEERDRGVTLVVLDRQIKQGLDGLTGDQIGSLVVAYEPVWAIGTGRNATAAAGRRSASPHPQPHPPVVRRRGGGSLSRDLRRQRETRQHSRADGVAGGRWRACRRRESRDPRVLRHPGREAAKARYNRDLCFTT